MADAKIIVEDLRKSFGNELVLDGVELSVAQDAYAEMHNGPGKA